MRLRRHRWRPGLFVALLALAAQLAFGVAAQDVANPSPEQQLAALLADPGAICHGTADGGQQAPRHHGLDCALCPFCTTLAAVAVLHSGGYVLPAPRAGPIAAAIVFVPPATLPPAPPRAAPPRGPPFLG